MNSFMKTVQTNAIVQAVLFMVLGLVLMFVPDITLVTIVYLLAAIFAVSGLVSIFAYMREGSPSYEDVRRAHHGHIPHRGGARHVRLPGRSAPGSSPCF